ncbi:D-tagatose-1,6-bisphosphate aldolase subunit KbaY [Candidatus Hepatoplasma crinochetorum Av]|uniref:D-tagatose-1,6-bisphosphate aldolase subunit KbaY n=1 Tax=Candidatus Hepatoplasma crinochetorum Av TaxID=1427984 RepID=W8GGB1_9MOLU|nr:ketose-bisphosphate aldolase [Candidatus Hepatoplasma crinochetorum]AHK22638.1 D-tagatose-1,6-bisphosphate aldolase subunit KbaY [Candidatus Hepatoplasma crinochetorum Av]
MPLVKGKILIKDAIKRNYAIPAFGIVNLEGAKAAIEAAEELNAPIILQTTEGGINYAGHEELAAIAIASAKKAKVPVAVHLDHGRNIEYHKRSLELGYTSLMIDGSTLPFDENIKITNKVKSLIKDQDISLEAELGMIGGKEDDIEEEADHFTKVEDAIKFINNTNIDMLAIACGTSHGFYVKEPKINISLIKEIYDKTKKPLVLHGGTGVPLNQITKAVQAGIRKANFDSELKKAIICGILEYMYKNPDAFDLRKIFQEGINQAKEVAKSKIKAVQADGKNWLR